ncbi:hypothetical protein BD770DRAFT_334399 [Pilaira anomala]|nr:hypothetical protein BD770DRAFT_334399 [Pilaira anomala]
MLREQQRQIRELVDPIDNSLHTDRLQLERIAQSFYFTLYSPSPVEAEVVQKLLDNIPAHTRISKEVGDTLLDPIKLTDIILESKRSPKKSSPGSDGLPYEILHLIMLFAPSQPVILKVYNDALEKSVFPKSWNDSIMSLLSKKGNLSDLKNYCPILLANTDYKIFTRILNR